MLAQHNTKQFLHYVHSPSHSSILVMAPVVGIENNKVRYLAAIFIQLNPKLTSEAKSEASGVRVACIVESGLLAWRNHSFTTSPKKARQVNSNVKNMIITFFDVKGNLSQQAKL